MEGRDTGWEVETGMELGLSVDGGLGVGLTHQSSSSGTFVFFLLVSPLVTCVEIFF